MQRWRSRQAGKNNEMGASSLSAWEVFFAYVRESDDDRLVAASQSITKASLSEGQRTNSQDAQNTVV